MTWRPTGCAFGSTQTYTARGKAHHLVSCLRLGPETQVCIEKPTQHQHEPRASTYYCRQTKLPSVPFHLSCCLCERALLTSRAPPPARAIFLLVPSLACRKTIAVFSLLDVHDARHECKASGPHNCFRGGNSTTRRKNSPAEVVFARTESFKFMERVKTMVRS